MAEIILNTDDLTVLGGPSQITLETNVGPAGNRGVFVMYGLLEPNDPLAQFIATPQIFDLYIVTNPSSENYLQMYQYLSQDGIIQWYPAIKLRPNFYATNKLVTFIDGEATIDINIFELGLVNLGAEIPTLEGTRFYFSVQATLNNFEALSILNPLVPENHYPAATSIVVDDIYQDEVSEELFVPITIKAAEFTGTAWQNIDSKNVIVSLSILVVNPTEILEAIGGS